MRLHLGRPVATIDGHFGTLADIVIDPLDNIVTHLVVEPEHQHHQARLVPLYLVAERDDQLVIELDVPHARELRLVAETDYLRIGDPPDLDRDWDVGIQQVLALPYWSSTLVAIPELDERVTVTYDRIPKGECEIRRNSTIVSADGHTVGHVEGLLVDDDAIVAVVTRHEVIGFGRQRVIPIAGVAAVSNDRIDLVLTRPAFRQLPPVPDAFTGFTAQADQT